MTNTGGIGFHLGSGGNKTGLGEWIASLNSAKISIFLKSSDSYGEIWEAIQSGNVSNVENLVIYRLTQEDQNPANNPLGVQNVPDYTLPPSIAAKNHCDAILIALEKTPEFDKQKTWLDMINEPRTKKAPGDIQYMDMNAMDWLGECCYEIALYMNDKGFRVALPSINSGEPGIDMQDAVIQYSQPGFLRYLDYCAKNPSIAMVTVHEYVWDKYLTDETFEDWYPHLFGRCEAMIAAADLAGIPRAFGIAMTEWGFAATHAPEWEQAKPHIVDYTAWMSRFSQVKGVASWTLQGGKDWGNVSDAIQTWITPLINYTKNERPSIAEQPQKTHELFGGTLPKGNVMTLTAKYNLNWELPRAEPEEIVKLRIVEQVWNGETWINDGITGIDLGQEEGLKKRFVFSQMVDDGTQPPTESPIIDPILSNALGVDVSAHQGLFDWDLAVENGVTYAIIRSSNGLGTNTTDEEGRDKFLYRNARMLTELGIPWAIYHFLQDDESMQKQANLVNDILEDLMEIKTYPQTGIFANGDLLPNVFVDIEKTILTPDQITEFYVTLNSIHGYDVGIYTSKSIWDFIMGKQKIWWEDVFCWVAAYGANTGYPPNWKPWIPFGFKENTIWQYTSKGGHLIGSDSGLDLNMATPFEQETAPPIEPPAETIDILPYLRAASGTNIDIDATAYTQTLNTQHGNNDIWRLVKGGNGQYEYLYFDEKNIYRREDTSQGDDRFYCHYTNGVQGAVWIPRQVEMGKTYQTQKQVTHYWNDCTIRDNLELVDVVDNIKAVAIHDSFTFSKTGQTVDDVLELFWIDGNETYYFANGGGLVGFKDDKQDAQFLIQNFGREPLPFNTPSCINDDVRFYA